MFRASRNPHWLFALLAAVTTALVFLPCLQNDFITTWDDEGYVINNPQLNEMSFRGLKEIFSNDILGNYNPLVILSFSVEKHFWGLNPFVFHLDNWILHVICTVLVFRLTWLLYPSLIVSFMVSLLFGIHPLHVESVAWVTERKDVLFGMFYFSALIAYVHYAYTLRRRFLLFCGFFFVLSLLSKIQAVTLPLSLLCIDYFLQRKMNRSVIFEKLPMFALSVFFGLLGMYFLKEMKAFFVSSDIPIYQRPFIGSYALLIYFIKSVLPYKIAAFYPYPKGSEMIGAYSSILFIPLLVFLIFKFFRTNRALVFGLLFFIVNIVFLLQMVEAGGAFLADRFSYVSFFSLFFIYGTFFEKWLLRNLNLKLIWLTLAACYFIFLATLSSNRIRVWKDDLTFWNDEIRKYPAVSISYPIRAGVFYKLGRLDKAIGDLSTYIALRPFSTDGFLKRGLIYEEMKNYPAAIQDFTSAIALNPDYKNVLLHRANCYLAMKQFEKAIADCNALLAIHPSDADAWNTLGSIHFAQGLYGEALDDINKVLILDSNYKDSYRNRGMLYQLLGDRQKALDDFGRHLRLFPRDSTVMRWRLQVQERQ